MYTYFFYSQWRGLWGGAKIRPNCYLNIRSRCPFFPRGRIHIFKMRIHNIAESSRVGSEGEFEYSIVDYQKSQILLFEVKKGVRCYTVRLLCPSVISIISVDWTFFLWFFYFGLEKSFELYFSLQICLKIVSNTRKVGPK